MGVESFSHPTCEFYLVDNQLNKKETTLLKSKLSQRGYKFVKEVSMKETINYMADSLYVETSRILSGKVYKECLVEINIKKAEGPRPSSKDKSLYKNSSLRKFPRQTFHGNERCFMALSDLTFGINFCKAGNKR
ncbi:hypothetical protein M900_A0375 [Bacteriovorax sp. Seq25_V]|nr:hypothetical protein M900_A0375 [Bacteriovorax sp. Seq25_V]